MLLLTLKLNGDQDVVSARQYARRVAESLGFDSQGQTRIATAVSEIARNASRYARGGEVMFSLEGERSPQQLIVRVVDRGGGIANLEEVLTGRYRSTTGMGMGIVGARRLADRFDIQSGPGGTEVMLAKTLPSQAPLVSAQQQARLSEGLKSEVAATGAIAETQQQNRELMAALSELRERQEELGALNAELEETNRGVVALYAELDEKALQLRQADQMKSRFLSNMSHEFRTPLNAIRALTRMLAEENDGPLNAEQQKQLGFIRRSADELGEMVNDLLDLAKIEAGKTEVSPAQFSVPELFAIQRGIFRPLVTRDSVTLTFEEPSGMPPLVTDEGKVAQILRNLVSNALKFTEAGTITVSAGYDDADDTAWFRIADTGIGISGNDLHNIFDEFTQVRNPLQARSKGTGLGLPLCRKLAGLLGGTVEAQSTPGHGSVFTLKLPAHYQAVPDTAADLFTPPLAVPADDRRHLLLIDDDPAVRYAMHRMLDRPGYVIDEATDARSGLSQAAALHPRLIVLDLSLPDGRGEDVLAALNPDPGGESVPVIIATSSELDADALRALKSRARTVISKQDLATRLIPAVDAIIGAADRGSLP